KRSRRTSQAIRRRRKRLSAFTFLDILSIYRTDIKAISRRYHRSIARARDGHVRLTVGSKLAISFAVVVIMMGINVWVGLQGLGQVVGTYQGEVARIIEARAQTQEIERLASEQVQAIMGYLITLDEVHRRSFVNASLAINQIINGLKETAPSDEALELLDRVSQTKTEFERLASPLMERVLSQQQLRSILTGELGTRRDALLAATRALNEYQNARVLAVHEAPAAQRARA